MSDPGRHDDQDATARTTDLRTARSAGLLAPAVLADALISSDTAYAWASMLDALADGANYADLAIDLVGPALSEVGARWAERRITVAQEHLATVNATALLGRAFLQADVAVANGRKAVFACVQGNHHALGVRILSDSFALAGWDVRSLGANVPTDDLIEFVRSEAPDVVGLSLSHPDQADAARAVTAAVRAAAKDRSPIVVVGGYPFVSGALTAVDVGADAAYQDVRSAVDALG